MIPTSGRRRRGERICVRVAGARCGSSGRGLDPLRHDGLMTSTSPAYQSLNPATGEVLETFPAATDAEVESALAATHAAYLSWRDVPIEKRAEVVTRIGELFVERADALAELATKEMGKPLAEAAEEAAFCGDIFGYFADEGPTLAADQPIKTFSGGRAVVQKLPIGAAARDHAVELPLLPGGPVRGAQPDAGQHHRAQARGVGARLRARGRADHEGRRASRGRLRQPLRDPRPDRDGHRRRPDRRASP